MNADDAHAIIRANVDRLRDQLRLWDWHIDVRCKRLNEGTAGQCQVQAPYLRASIEIDNEQVSDERELLHVLRHELVHVFCWPFHAYGEHVAEMTEGDSVDSAWTFYLERMVWSVEKLLDAVEKKVGKADV